MSDEKYWAWMKDICVNVFDKTKDGGSLYFMQREKNCENVLRVTRESGWVFQNLIVWKKWTSAAAPSNYKHPKHYQIIVFATKGDRSKTFNKLRIEPPILSHHKFERENGMFVTDLWDDIKELTAGYFSSEETITNGKMEIGFIGTKHSSDWVTKNALRLEGVWTNDLIKQFLKPEILMDLDSQNLCEYKEKDISKKKVVAFSLKQINKVEKSPEFLKKIKDERFHDQQSPLALLTRIILTSSNTGDCILDPFAGSGTTGCVAQQLKRNSISIEIDPKNVKCANERVANIRPEDCILKYKEDYKCTENLNRIWG
jgi:DNA modification methylase